MAVMTHSPGARALAGSEIRAEKPGKATKGLDLSPARAEKKSGTRKSSFGFLLEAKRILLGAAKGSRKEPVRDFHTDSRINMRKNILTKAGVLVSGLEKKPTSAGAEGERGKAVSALLSEVKKKPELKDEVENEKGKIFAPADMTPSVRTEGATEPSVAKNTAEISRDQTLHQKVFVVDLRKPKNTGERVLENGHETTNRSSVHSEFEVGGIKVPDRSVFGSKEVHSGLTAPIGDLPRGTTERFHDTLRSEVLRRAGLVIRDGGGEMRLILKPESLGSVRINLNLTGNHIEGRIIVENNTVKQLFESQLFHLSQAFKEDGFESTALEVSVGGRQGRRSPRDPDFREASRRFEDHTAVVEQTSLGDWLVNLTA